MARTSTRIRGVMDRRFSVGILVLALASTATFLVSLHLSRTESHRAEAISLVAGQRALSQRIAFLVSALHERGGAGVAEELVVATDAMAAGHDMLTLREEHPHDLSRFLDPIQGVYFAGYMPFDLAVQRFIEDARSLAALEPGTPAWEAATPTRAFVVSQGADSMMQTHDLMVRIMEAEAQNAVAKAERADTALWGFVLTVLGLTVLCVYGPLRRHIERSVAELEAAQTEATRAARAAEAANAAKGHFLQAASHELKTPLNAITGFADVIGSGKDADDEALSQMQLASEHLSVLLDAILDTHRADEGNLTLSDEPFEPAGVLAKAARMGGALAERKGLRFEPDLDIDDALSLRGDASRLRQICLNLIDNAVKFTEDGTVSLEARIDAAADGEATLVIAVTDTGRGIATDRLDRIFDRFNPQGEITQRGGGGLGIGLALTRQLTELMGGAIEIDSAEGEGTHARITLDLPIVRRAPIGQDGAAAIDDERPPRVLIVDDNAPNRMVADALVRANDGLTVLCADGAQAVQAANAAAEGGQPFDLILMDISMPVMDGIEATRAIREAPLGADVPIVAVTAHVSQSEVPRMLARGFDAVVHKPIGREVIADTMTRWTAPRFEEEAS